MDEEISLQNFAILSILAVVLTALGTLFIFGSGTFITGFSVSGNVTITVNNTTAIELPNDTINFGLMDVNTEDNTSDGSPGPFVLENAGNVDVNVTIEATDLWSRAGYENPTAYYKFNSSLNESGSVAAGGSLASWTNMPNTSSPTDVVTQLHPNASKDSVKINIHIHVPDEEPAGSKLSTVTFRAEMS